MGKETTITPMMEQYLRLKEKHKDKLLFYRMGDFYELFFEDAQIASSVMEIALTSRGKHLDVDIPMCGIPHLKLDQYLIKLIKAGYVVAICEQTETADEAKKRGYKAIVKRDVTRIITPGTLIDESHLESSKNNFLFTFAEVNDSSSAAWLDLSTGSIFLKCIRKESIFDLINEVNPSELIFCSETFSELISKKNLGSKKITLLNEAAYFNETALSDFIELNDKDSFTDAEITTIKYLIGYCHETNLPKKLFFSRPIRISTKNFLEMDVFTKNNLEIITNARGERKDTLLSSIDNTVTSFGSRLLENWLNYPLVSTHKIDARLDKVQALYEKFFTLEAIRDLLKKIPDLERATTRLQLNRGTPIDLNYLKVGLSKSKEINDKLSSNEFINVFDDSGIHTLSSVIETLELSIEESPSSNIKEGNFIKKGYSQELDKNRDLQESGKRIIASMQTDLIKETGINSLKIKFNNTLGYFIETPSGYSKKILGEEYFNIFFHRQSTANSVRFTSSELLEIESKILNAREICLNLEVKIFEEISSLILSESTQIRRICDYIAELDVYCSTAFSAKKNQWVRPELLKTRDLLISGGRHPVIESSLKQHSAAEFIPNDCSLSRENTFINLVTGPNMAGKSTFLRQNALIAILAHMGSYVPAREAKIGQISKIFCRMGAADNLARGESTFMVEMRETAQILKNADDKTLVILDEVGRGTSTYDGMSIAWSCLEHLHEVNKSRTIFATHYHELTRMADYFEGILNLSVSAKEWKGKLIFLHKIIKGKASGSFGIKIAELAGLPKNVVKNADNILKSLKKSSTFSEPNPDRSLSSQTDVKDKKDSDLIIDTLQKLDLDSTSPKMALEILYKLRGSIH